MHLPLALVAVALVSALVAGVVISPHARRWVKGADGEEDSAHDLGSIAGPIVGITTLVLSFGLVNVWGSFHEATLKAHAEAVAVDYQLDMAQLLPDPKIRRDLAATLVCYSRAVAGPEWDLMEIRTDATADEVDPWSDRIQATVGELANVASGPSAITRDLMSADKERAEARSQRLIQARPTIPGPVILFMVLAASTVVLALAIAYLPTQRRSLHVAVLTAVSVLFLGLFAMISEMDTPYWGAIAVKSTDLTRVAAAATADFSRTYPGVPLPCDDSGRKLR